MEVLPVLSKNIFNSAHINSKSSFDLLCPNDLIGDSRETSDSIQHCRLMLLGRLIVEELISKNFNIFFYLTKKFDLILLNGTLDLRSGEQSVENVEHSEHFISIFGL
jgi:hypothetical protein